MWSRLKVTYSASGRSLALRFPRSCLPSPSHGSEHWLCQLGVGTIGAQGLPLWAPSSSLPLAFGRACPSPAFLFLLQKKKPSVETEDGEDLLEENAGEEEEAGEQAGEEREEDVST